MRAGHSCFVISVAVSGSLAVATHQAKQEDELAIVGAVRQDVHPTAQGTKAI